ncbi:GntR family transcriptional regulator [bacterium LRH843]|nr:GntR family transcriptional regulator [bacterium LRH843]
MGTADNFNLNLNERVYLHIRNKIVNNELKPGTRLDYSQFQKELGISKTPLRDAFHFLQQDGLIEVKSRSGTFVSTPDAKDIEEIYNIRKALEREAIGSAVERVSKETLELLLEDVMIADEAINKGEFQPFFESDRNLHNTFIYSSGNQRLIKIMDSLETQIAWLGVIIAKSNERPYQASIRHKQLLSALLEEDTIAAQTIMEQHIEEIKQMTLKDFL